MFTRNKRAKLFEGDYFSIHQSQDGIEYVWAENEVLVVPLTSHNQVILIREPAPAFASTELVLPGGTVAYGESLSRTANRELQEETGYGANKLELLGELRPFAKYLSVRTFVFLARNLAKRPLRGDEPFEIIKQRIYLRSFEKLIADRELLDARTIAALYMTRAFLSK